MNIHFQFFGDILRSGTAGSRDDPVFCIILLATSNILMFKSREI